MLEPIGFEKVRLTDSFWQPRVETLRTTTMAHVFDWCEKTGRIANFEIAAGQKQGPHEGYFFNDSDVYKAIEGAAYLLQLQPDPQWQQRVDKVIDIIAAAQQDDGYLNTYFQVAKPGERWTNDRFHELYCAGHLIEAGIAYFHATGERKLLDIAIRFANHIDQTFGPGKRLEAPEHPEIELALVKLWRETNDDRYLKLSQFFVEQRGQDRGREPWGEYAQDQAPIREQTAVVGHAVRAMYLYSAMTDLTGIVGAEKGFDETLDRLWKDLTERKMYITGGVGVSQSNEGFTESYDLPNEHSYAETCASIGLALWAERMCRLHHDGQYADVLERVIYNGALSGVSLSGDKFLYANPLASRGLGGKKHGSAGQGDSECHRRPWFTCACCPPNVLRFFPQVGGMIYARDGDDIYVNLYVGSETTIPVAGTNVKLVQATQYPWDGGVKIGLAPEEPTEFTLYLRIPGWCEAPHLSVNRMAFPELEIKNGYVAVTRKWQRGDTVLLGLSMSVKRMVSHPEVGADVGRTALMRGPLVYCFEQADSPDGVLDMVISPKGSIATEERPDLLDGVVVLHGQGTLLQRSAWEGKLYQPLEALVAQPLNFTAVPYYAWDNRSPGEMIVWVRTGLP